MGESRGGEGRGGTPSPDQAAAELVRQYLDEGLEVGAMLITRVTEGTYRFDVTFHDGTPGKVVILEGLAPDAHLDASTPSGGNTGGSS